MPVAVAPDDALASNAPDPSVVAGYVDCLKEALKFLLERERLSPQHPVVAGLALHLARPGAQNFLRRAPTQATASAGRRRNEHESQSERRLHQVQRTTSIGKQRAPIRRRLVHNNASFPGVSSSQPAESSSHRDINGELRHNLQNIVDNLECAINDTRVQDELEDYFSDEDEAEAINEDEHPETYPHYNVTDNDLDAEIDTFLGDSVLRRELVRLVYQGCDLIATAPLQLPSSTLDASPASPQIGATAEPDHPLPQPI
ncbi:hypothetical protein FHG87_013906 [Trinorchestia longiramus]|nr:hypothetical protein FHG87_013906 [Trinorchestia longiramus]